MDDSLTARGLLKRALKNANYQVVAEASSGENAIVEYERCHPDIVTMDLDMPGIGGIEAARRILELDPQAKIIIVTAHEKNDLADISSRNGFEYTINKPVSEHAVVSVFEKILKDKNTKVGSDVKKNNGTKFENADKEIVKQDKELDAKSIEEDEIYIYGEQDVVLNVDLAVMMSHYSRLNCFRGTINDTGKNTLIIKVEPGISVVNFFENDPVVIGYKEDDNYAVVGYRISSMDARLRTVNLRYNQIYNLSERNLSEKMPVSLYVDFKEIKQKKKFSGVIRSIGVNNMDVSSSVELNVDDNLEFYMPMFENLTYIKAVVTERHKRTKACDYSLKIIYNAFDNKMDVVKWYINSLKDQYFRGIEEVSSKYN